MILRVWTNPYGEGNSAQMIASGAFLRSARRAADQAAGAAAQFAEGANGKAMTVAIPLSAPDITEAEIAAVNAVLRTPHLSMGPELAAFEEELAAYHGVNDAVAVSSGTAGLHLALLTLGVGEGDEVILPRLRSWQWSTPCFRYVLRLSWRNSIPLTLNLDPAAVERAIRPAHLPSLRFTPSAYLPRWMHLRDLARSPSIVPDRRRIRGHRRALRPAHRWQLRRSRSPRLLSQQANHHRRRRRRAGPRFTHAARLRRLEIKAATKRRLARPAEPGYNYRLSELACALGRIQLRRIDDILALRRQAAERYDALLAGIPGLERPPLSLPGRELSWFVYVVRLPEDVNRDQVQAELAHRGIATGRYFSPIHLQPVWRAFGGQEPGHFPLTESIARRTLALPFFNRITADQQQEVTEALRGAISCSIECPDSATSLNCQLAGSVAEPSAESSPASGGMISGR